MTRPATTRPNSRRPWTGLRPGSGPIRYGRNRFCRSLDPRAARRHQHLDLANREAQIIGKGGSAERVFWDSEAARLLARLVAGRRRGPVFLANKSPFPARQPAAGDIDPDTGRARLAYRRAEEIFKAASGGRTLHKLRHSRLTHLADAGEDVTVTKARSRHRSLRSLERYVNPSNAAVASSPTATTPTGGSDDPRRRAPGPHPAHTLR